MELLYIFKKYTLSGLLCSMVVLGGCEAPEQKQDEDSHTHNFLQDWNESIRGNFSTQTGVILDSAEIDSFLHLYPRFRDYGNDVHRFYEGRQYAYAWFDDDELIEPAYNLMNRIRNIRDEGVMQELPYQQLQDSLIQDHMSRADYATTELFLTSSYFAFAHTVWEGMGDTAAKAVQWFLPRKKISYQEYLDRILKEDGDVFSEEEPVYRQYERLRTFLKLYRRLTAVPWPEIVLTQKSVKPGDSMPVIPAIRKRLSLLGDFSGDTMSHVYDEALQEAVLNFQYRHGLAEDGIIGKGVAAAMNVPIAARISQILVNMERSRWVPIRVTSDYLIVNIPEFRLHVYQEDSLVWSCNVVVGKNVHKTVVFHGDVKYVVFSPYWNVPPSIVRNEIVPGMQRNKNYLARHNMEITGNRGGLPVVRQKPGPSNSLGLVKFLFPNSYNIYLHDSPAKSLFNEESRAFSHGCIRVSEPERLAQFLLRKDTAWTDEEIHAAMHAGKEKYVTLKETVPVFIAYFTAFVDPRGQIHFRNDIYNRDGRMAEMLMQQGK